MGRKIVRLAPEHLDQIGAPCRSCLFWERDPVRRDRTADPGPEKAAWVAEVLRDWGTCGQVAVVDDVPVGYVVYAPPAFVPGAAGFPTAPVSAGAVLLTTVYVDPAAADRGLGKLLVQRMAGDLVKRDVRAVEAFGDTRGHGHCVLPVDFLEAVGFRTQRAHPTTPRMRMDLRTTVTWPSEVEAAVRHLVRAVRPAPKPTRAPKATRTRPLSGTGRPSAVRSSRTQAM